MSSDEQRIRELAYQIWESEGRPEGQTDRHWEMARKLVDSEHKGELLPGPTPAKPKRSRKTPAPADTPLEKPALLEKPGTAPKKPRAPRSKPSKP